MKVRSSYRDESFDDGSRYNPNTMSRLEDPGSSDEQGFVDDDPEQATDDMTLVQMRKRRSPNCRSFLLVLVAVAIITTAVLVPVLLNFSNKILTIVAAL